MKASEILLCLLALVAAAVGGYLAAWELYVAAMR